jgi:hypothetical protein
MLKNAVHNEVKVIVVHGISVTFQPFDNVHRRIEYIFSVGAKALPFPIECEFTERHIKKTQIDLKSVPGDP